MFWRIAFFLYKRRSNTYRTKQEREIQMRLQRRKKNVMINNVFGWRWSREAEPKDSKRRRSIDWLWVPERHRYKEKSGNRTVRFREDIHLRSSLLHRLAWQYFMQMVFPSVLFARHWDGWVRLSVDGGGIEQPRRNCTSFPRIMDCIKNKTRGFCCLCTGGVYGFFAVTNLLFRVAHHRRCLIGIDLTFAVLLRTFAGVTKHTYRRL